MNLSDEQMQNFFERINKLNYYQKPKFGKMNANQMICHWTDFFRMANGYKRAEEYGVTDSKEILKISRSGKSVPAPKGFGQIEGDGTTPTNFESDKASLKKHILEFSKRNKNYEFAEHPLFKLLVKVYNH